MRALSLLVAVTACTFDRPPDVKFGESSITITEGDGQTGVVTSKLPTLLKVNVTDGDFIPIENFSVEFSLRDTTGHLSEKVVRTDAQGNARTELTLGTRSGDQFVDVTGEGIENDAPVFFTMNALADVPAQISAHAGDGAMGTVADVLPTSLVARVEDQYGNPSPVGVDVAFAFGSGGGSVLTPVVTSGTDGTAATQVTLGTVAGPQTIDVTAEGLSGTSFTVNGIASAPTSIERVSPASLLAEALRPSEPMTVLARDAYGNPAPGAEVTFTRTAGTGTIATAVVTTGADGQASNTIVAATLIGGNTVVASASLTGSPITFNATTRTIRAPQTLSLPGKQTRIAVGDLNGDGLPDLVVPTQASGSPSFSGLTVYMNTTPAGATALTFSTTQVTSDVYSGGEVGLVDANGDGTLDILHHYNSIELIPNTTAMGATTFTRGTSVRSNANRGVPTLVDLNGDQLLDLFLASDSQAYACARTSAAFAFSSCMYVGGVNDTHSLSVQDVTADGKPDVSGFSSGNIVTYVNTSTIGGAITFSTVSTAASSYVYGTLADVDADGKPDWIVTQPSTSMRILRNTSAGTPTFGTPTDLVPGFYHPVLMDLNGDGRLDIAGVATSTYVRVSLSSGTATAPVFAAPETLPAAGLSTESYLHAADFNHDGHDDLLLDGGGGAAVQVILAQ